MGLMSTSMWFLKTRQVSYSILEHYIIEFQHQYDCTKFVVILATLTIGTCAHKLFLTFNLNLTIIPKSKIKVNWPVG